MKRHTGERGRGPAMMILKCAVWLALGAVLVGAVMQLWNWLMPSLFAGARAIDYWQTLGLIVLCRVLFGGGHGRWHGRHHHHHGMNEQERAHFRSRFMSRFGDHCGDRGGAPAGAGAESGQKGESHIKGDLQ